MKILAIDITIGTTICFLCNKIWRKTQKKTHTHTQKTANFPEETCQLTQGEKEGISIKEQSRGVCALFESKVLKQ